MGTALLKRSAGKTVIVTTAKSKRYEDKAQQTQIRLRLRKVGKWLTAEGVSPVAAKIKAIIDMPRPIDKKGVEWLLGCVTNIPLMFSPKACRLVAPCGNLLRTTQYLHGKLIRQKPLVPIFTNCP